ncbi:hypothetical protein KRX19_05740 [Cardiobacteriaceae bacterium TAE3-ERU3]|nr:hypothetical protein [Cardiobacteriaceae bacterium TAE3-ERU3]
MNITEALNEIVEIGSTIARLRDERDRVSQTISKLEKKISGKGNTHDPLLIMMLNEEISQSEGLKRAIDRDVLIHNGYKITIPADDGYICGTITVTKVYTPEDQQ